MEVSNQIRYEAQVARTGRAKCKICSMFVKKGDFIIKVLGYRVNQSIHPHCMPEIALTLGAALKDPDSFGIPSEADPIIRVQGNEVKAGYYKRLSDGKLRFNTTRVIVVGEKEVPRDVG